MDPNDDTHATHQQLCSSFTSVTSAEPDVALYYLKQRAWNLKKALNLFYDGDIPPSRMGGGCHGNSADGEMTSQGHHDSAASTSKSSSRSSSPDVVLEYQKGASSMSHPSVQHSSKELSQDQPPSPGFRLITWNIDGLDEGDIQERTRAVCRTLRKLNPDIVYLQEVIMPTLVLICSELGNYKPLPSSQSGYFTLILLRKSTVTHLSSKVEPFEDSKMTRALQIAECKCAGIDLHLLCTHLESTGNGAKERCNQFSRTLYRMKMAKGEQTVLFGGDTNLRDKEVGKVGLPDYIYDVWEMCGSSPDTKFTWDLTKNDNLNWPYPNRPKLRFDRLYLRHAKTAPRVRPLSFKLIGTERLEECKRFPSDHWGVVCDFQVTPA